MIELNIQWCKLLDLFWFTVLNWKYIIYAICWFCKWMLHLLTAIGNNITWTTKAVQIATEVVSMLKREKLKSLKGFFDTEEGEQRKW